MTARTAVADGVRMSDEQLGMLTRRHDELKRRINEGTLSYDWAMDEIQRLIEGRRAEDFFRYPEDLVIQIPALPRPTFDELRRKFSWIKKIERDTSPTGPVTLRFATILRADETSPVSVKEYERRIAPALPRLLGYQHCKWLTTHQDEYPALKTLLGKVYINFSGIVVVDSDGGRLFPYGNSHKRWTLLFSSFDVDFCLSGRVAVSSK